MDRVDDLSRVDSLEVNRRDAKVRVLDMRVIWRLAWRFRGGGCAHGVWPGGGDAVGAERRSPEGGRGGAPTACAPSGGGTIVPLRPVVLRKERCGEFRAEHAAGDGGIGAAVDHAWAIRWWMRIWSSSVPVAR